MIRKAALALSLLFCAFHAFAEGGGLQVKSVPEWENGRLLLTIIVPLDVDRLLFPEARRDAEQRAERVRGDLFLEAFSSVTLRSSQFVGEFLSDPHPGPHVRRVIEALPAMSSGGVRVSVTVSERFSSLTVVYAYSFFGVDGLLAPFIAGDRARPLPPSPGYHPTRPWTGLVIDARGKRTAFGKNVSAVCRPAFFPRIFYLSARETIEPLLDMTMVDPQALLQWGMVGYIRSSAKSAYAARAGNDPCTTAAFALYGTYDTDLVLSEDTARMLLSHEANRELLRKGKIAVIID